MGCCHSVMSVGITRRNQPSRDGETSSAVAEGVVDPYARNCGWHLHELPDFLSHVMIVGQGGYLRVDDDSGLVRTEHDTATRLHMEHAPKRFKKSADDDVLVTFRVHGTTNRYLTMVPFGSEAKQTLSEAIHEAKTPLLPEHISLIVEFLVGEESRNGDFEGAGFNYQPMRAISNQNTNSPNTSQVFVLEAANRDYPCDGILGVKSLFGKYWRSQHWKGTVSQSSHCLLDEHFLFDDPFLRHGSDENRRSTHIQLYHR